MTVLHIAVMALAFLYMFNKAHFAATRLVGLVPLLMLVADGCTAGVDFFAAPRRADGMHAPFGARLLLCRHAAGRAAV